MNTPVRWKWKLAQTLEYKWWQRYLKKQDPADYLLRKKAYWQKVLHALQTYDLVKPIGQTILDAGCGPAGIFIALEGNKVDAIDPLLDKYRELPHFRPEDCNWVNFITAPMEAFDAHEKYDIIFCMNAINHVNDIESCYDKLVQALKPEGTLVISTDAHRHGFLKRIFQLLPGDMLHPVQLDIKEYDAQLTKRGLKIEGEILYKEGNIFNYYITLAKKSGSLI